MKALKKALLLSLLIGGMLTTVLFVQGQNVKTSTNDNDFSSQTYVYAGVNVTICDNDNFKTQGISTFKGVTFWKTSGDGVFENPHDLQTVYFPGEKDKANGEVNLNLLYLQSEDTKGKKSKATASDSMTLNFENCSLFWKNKTQ